MLSETHRLSHLLNQLVHADGRTTARLGDLTLSSHFQPIFSLSHARVVGHEALLRAHTADGRPVSPPEVFAGCTTDRELAVCDTLSRLLHTHNFVAQDPGCQWVFLNIHPTVFQRMTRLPERGDPGLCAVLGQLKLPSERVVFEVLETEMSDLSAMERAMETVRQHGCLIAIDDFGAGQSNFDRVWRLRPDIVKLDRSLVARAAQDRRTHRVISQMVSLLHECGAMVLMEGVETIDEAMVAMDSDVDMVQGYHFGRPQPLLLNEDGMSDAVTGLYARLADLRQQQRRDRQLQLAPYQNAIGRAGVQMAAGAAPLPSYRDFLALPCAEVAYVLDGDGYNLGELHWQKDRRPLIRPGYEPMARSEGACWSRRPYFRRALEAVGTVQTSRPYRTSHGQHLCVTISYAYPVQHAGREELRVLCGDVVWNEGPAPRDGPP